MRLSLSGLAGAFVPDGGAEVREFENPATPSGRPGAHVPHAELQGIEGLLQPRKLLGSYFMAFTAAGHGAAAAESAAKNLGFALKAYRVASVQPLGAGPEGTVLVRPDGVVAWRGADPADLEPALRTVLCR